MDPSAVLDFHQSWGRERRGMIEKHKANLAFQEDLLGKEKKELRESSERNLRKLKETVPPALYSDVIGPMVEKSLRHDLQQIQTGYQKRIELIEKSHREEYVRHEIAYHEKLSVYKISNDGLRNSVSAGNDGISPPQDGTTEPSSLRNGDQPTSWTPTKSRSQTPKLSKPLTCTVQHETVSGERRLIMRILTQKRRASVSRESPSKRLRVDTSVNPLRTPNDTPLAESTRSACRTIRFDEVYQDGRAEHKDTIVEWPSGSQKWYILKCEEHGVRFTRNSIMGAAKHLNGISHGFPDRNRDSAVKALGYLVVDCTETLARLNNEVAEEAYASGYKPAVVKSRYQIMKESKKQQARAEEFARSSSPYAGNSDARLTPGTTTSEKPMIEGRERSSVSSTPTTLSSLRGSHRVITNPKTFHIYHGNWRSNQHQKDSTQIYPVMILGWDSQNGSGLKGTPTLNATGLLEKRSHPPSCYIYESNKIVDWAPGYENGGPKVESRKFPVMFFDESQTVGWLAARDLTRFPLYQRKAPTGPDHPFNAARRWIAEREGFSTWEDREKGRLQERESLPSIIRDDLPTVGDDQDTPGSDSDLESVSTATADTEKLMEEWREKGGEIPGDEDYSASESEPEPGGNPLKGRRNPDGALDTLEKRSTPLELSAGDVEERRTYFDSRNKRGLDQAFLSLTNHGDAGRPWAFYGLRSAESADQSVQPLDPAPEAQGHPQKTRRSAVSDTTEPRREGAFQAMQRAIELNNSFLNNRDSDEDPRKAQAAEDNSNHTTRQALGPIQSYLPKTVLDSQQPIRQHSAPCAPSSAQLPSGDRAASAPYNGVSDIIRSRTISAIATKDVSGAATPELEGSEMICAEDSNEGMPSFSRGASSDAKADARPEAQRDTCRHTHASGSKRVLDVGNEDETEEVRAEIMVGVRGPLAENRQARSPNKAVPAQSMQDENKANGQKENSLPDDGTASSSTIFPAASSVPGPTDKHPSNAIEVALSSGNADFELSRYSNGFVSWERRGEQENCLKLFYDGERRLVATWRGPIDVKIDPMDISGFSRDIISGSNGNSVYTLKNNNGSLWRLVFDRSRGSKLEIGKIQGRGFIRWLRSVNPDIKCLES